MSGCLSFIKPYKSQINKKSIFSFHLGDIGKVAAFFPDIHPVTHQPGPRHFKTAVFYGDVDKPLRRAVKQGTNFDAGGFSGFHVGDRQSKGLLRLPGTRGWRPADQWSVPC